jgi:hypothetical protein
MFELTRTCIRNCLEQDRDAVAGGVPTSRLLETQRARPSNRYVLASRTCETTRYAAIPGPWYTNLLHSNERVKGVPLTSKSGVCWMSQLHTDAVLCGINIAPHVVLSAGGYGRGMPRSNCWP